MRCGKHFTQRREPFPLDGDHSRPLADDFSGFTRAKLFGYPPRPILAISSNKLVK